MRAGLNQYPPMAGVPRAARGASPRRSRRSTATRYDPATEITITAGATQAILTAMLAFVHPGDEVIVLDPCYDSYEPNIELAGGVAVHVPLVAGTFAPDFERIAAALDPRTRAIIINSPHNPSGTVWTRRGHGAAWPSCCDRPTSSSSATRSTSTWSTTARAPERGAIPRTGRAQRRDLELRQDLSRHRLEGRLRGRAGGAERRVPQGAPVQRLHRQHADAARPGRATWPMPSHHLGLPAFYQRKRDLFRAGLERTRLRTLPCAGHLLPVRRLLRRQRAAGGRLLPLADGRNRRRGDPARRRSTPTASTSASRASASPRRTRRWRWPSTGWRSSDSSSGAGTRDVEVERCGSADRAAFELCECDGVGELDGQRARRSAHRRAAAAGRARRRVARRCRPDRARSRRGTAGRGRREGRGVSAVGSRRKEPGLERLASHQRRRPRATCSSAKVCGYCVERAADHRWAVPGRRRCAEAVVEGFADRSVAQPVAAAPMDLEQLQVGQRAAGAVALRCASQQGDRRLVLAEDDEELGLLLEIDQGFHRRCGEAASSMPTSRCGPYRRPSAVSSAPQA